MSSNDELISDKNHSRHFSRSCYIFLIFLGLFSLSTIIFITYSLYLYAKNIIGSNNPHGVFPCAYDEEGYWSVSFLRLQGEGLGPLSVKQILYSSNKFNGRFNQSDEDAGFDALDRRYYTKIRPVKISPDIGQTNRDGAKIKSALYRFASCPTESAAFQILQCWHHAHSMLT